MKETIFDSLPVIGKSLAEIKLSDKYRENCPAGSALAMSIAQNAVQLKKPVSYTHLTLPTTERV